ncbi:hypothetical protein H0H92_004706, partial [Tricholoma furcatifolium]
MTETSEAYSKSEQVSSPSDGNLDSILRTRVDVYHDGFQELLARRVEWWESTRVKSWLLQRGYTLYCRMHFDGYDGLILSEVFPPNVERKENSFPSAHHGGLDLENPPIFHAFTGERWIVNYAYDAQGRHFALKAILDGSEELRILKYLHNQGIPPSVDEFENVIPIVDIMACEGHWIAVMPRIAHGDIKVDNILVNHVDRFSLDQNSSRRMALRKEGKITYALFDFSHSTMFPLSAALEDCRLPRINSLKTFPTQRPSDTLQGEIDFNPFAFDVGMLGVLLCHQFQHLTRLIPMLAPLLDRMTTRNILRRFMASDALEFFEQKVLAQHTEIWCGELADVRMYYDMYDRWDGLDPQFIQEWSDF